MPLTALGIQPVQRSISIRACVPAPAGPLVLPVPAVPSACACFQPVTSVEYIMHRKYSVE